MMKINSKVLIGFLVTLFFLKWESFIMLLLSMEVSLIVYYILLSSSTSFSLLFLFLLTVVVEALFGLSLLVFLIKKTSSLNIKFLL